MREASLGFQAIHASRHWPPPSIKHHQPQPTWPLTSIESTTLLLLQPFFFALIGVAASLSRSASICTGGCRARGEGGDDQGGGKLLCLKRASGPQGLWA